jgi:hypothetical protein
VIRCSGLVLIAALLAACGRAPVPPGYDFVTHSLPSGSSMAAMLPGVLAITKDEASGAWCLVVVTGSRDVAYVAWPGQFRLVPSGDGRVEVHGGGRVFRQDEEVRLGGGEIAAGIRHSIQGACRSSHYFAVQSFP